MSRVASSVITGAERGSKPSSASARSSPLPTQLNVERLIGDQPTRWWALSGAWLAVAFTASLGLFVNFRTQGSDYTFFATLTVVVPHYLFWVIVSPPIYRALHKTLEGRRRALWLLMLVGWSVIALAGSTGMSNLSYVIRHDLRPSIAQLVDVYFLGPAGPAFWALNFSILLLALAAFAGVRSLRLRDQALWSAAQAELGKARLEAQLADARFLTLQAQINPHFLFNSLNAIAGLVESGERQRATEAIGRLGELLRLALRNGRNLMVTLGDELDFLQSYLVLCKLRFDESFSYCISVPESLRARRVPALIVQPLIENSIRHGMRPQAPLKVDIHAYELNGAIVIEVEDDGCGISAERARALPAGHGLANVHERLRLCFGSAGDLRLEPGRDRGTCARITIGR